MVGPRERLFGIYDHWISTRTAGKVYDSREEFFAELMTTPGFLRVQESFLEGDLSNVLSMVDFPNSLNGSSMYFSGGILGSWGYHCGGCEKEISGSAGSIDFDDIGPLRGARGVRYICRNCGCELGREIHMRA